MCVCVRALMENTHQHDSSAAALLPFIFSLNHSSYTVVRADGRWTPYPGKQDLYGLIRTLQHHCLYSADYLTFHKRQKRWSSLHLIISLRRRAPRRPPKKKNPVRRILHYALKISQPNGIFHRPLLPVQYRATPDASSKHLTDGFLAHVCEMIDMNKRESEEHQRLSS